MSDVAELDTTEWINVGSNIRDRRREQRLTMVELAHLCALSQPFLSQVENGRAKPSMDSLYRIARALDTTPQALFGSRTNSTTTPSLVRSAEGIGVALRQSASESTVRLLLPGDVPFHVLEFDGLPTEFLDYWDHDGFEAIYVLSGDIEVDVAGTISQLGPGDFLSYPSRLPHRHRSSRGAAAKVLLIETSIDGTHEPRHGSPHGDLRHHTSVLRRHHDD
jgi:transcriptional regulator with XRE-family HTH domain